VSKKEKKALKFTDIITILKALAPIPALVVAVYGGYKWSFKKGYEKGLNLAKLSPTAK